MSFFDIKLSSRLPTRDAAHRAMARELAIAVNGAVTDLGDRLEAVFLDNLGTTPTALEADFDVDDPSSGAVYATVVTADLIEIDETDIFNPVLIDTYGYHMDIRIDLSAVRVRTNNFEVDTLSRWVGQPVTRRTLERWQRDKRVAMGRPDDKVDFEEVRRGDVNYHASIEFPKHAFAGG